MDHTRREVIRGSSVVASVGLAGCQRLWSCSADVACFEFEHEGYDDAPDILTITHTGGDALPATAVFVTNVAVNYDADETGTVPWPELSETTDETDDIGGDSVEVEILFPEVVQVLWRHDGDERVIGETRSFR